MCLLKMQKSNSRNIYIVITSRNKRGVKLLTNSYIHIPYVGYETEKKIWNSGIKNWESFDATNFNMPSFRTKHIKKFVDLSIDCLNKENHSFFSSLLPRQEHWRCLKDFSKIAYLDIETTGLDKTNDDITMIGVYDGDNVKTFVKGKDLLDFKNYISSFPMIVTFNGSCFDLPFLSSKLGTKFNQVHLDLRFAFRKLGISGGLKRIEKVFGLNRSEDTTGIDGFEAVRLWYKYIKGDDSALELLKKYNAEDVTGLKELSTKAYDMLRKRL